MNNDKKYWVAVNGSSAAVSAVPMEPYSFTVSPTPEQLFGFPTREQQLSAQTRMLHLPMPKLIEWMDSLGPKVRSGEVAYVRPECPEPTAEITLWQLDGGRTASVADGSHTTQRCF